LDVKVVIVVGFLIYISTKKENLHQCSTKTKIKVVINSNKKAKNKIVCIDF